VGSGGALAPRRRVAVLHGRTVAVVIPAHDEERLVGATIDGLPAFVDRTYVVDDGSRDGTAEQARARNVEVIVHERNLGVGAAILTGYGRALADGVEVICVMAADNQMPAEDLELIAGPVARGEADYAKANRLFTGEAWKIMPRHRYLGGAILSFLTKIASGYWHVADSQSGFTALSRETLEKLDVERIYPRYGFPNDLLVHLNVINARVRDVPSRPVYGVGEKSGIKLRRVVPRISWLLVKAFFWRLREKYVIRDFHPLVLFYALGMLFSLLGAALGTWLLVARLFGNDLTVGSVVLAALLLISGSQFMLFAMWFDMESNKELR
jgi:glycosyltransferase involved in cell wall biosynthesis